MANSYYEIIFHIKKIDILLGIQGVYWFVFVIASQRHLTIMEATQTMSYEKLCAKGKEVTFEPDMYYSQEITADQSHAYIAFVGSAAGIFIRYIGN